MNQQRLAAAFFHNSSDAEQAVAALRQAGFAQIGVAERDDNQERKLAQKTDAQPGVAVSPDAGGQLLHTGGESDYADAQDMHATLLAANLPENEAGYFGDQMADNGVLVTVLAPADHYEEARRTLSTNGGDIGENVATTPAPASASARPPSGAEADPGRRRIELRGELLNVYKQRVSAGEARVSKQVVTEPKTVEVPVQREELVVERHPAPAGTPASGPVTGGEEVRVPLSEDKVTAEKKSVVNEIVDVGKRTSQGTETVQDKVKREVLNVGEEAKAKAAEEAERLRRKIA